MASSSHSRGWMDNRLDPLTNSVTEEFIVGMNVFISFACQQPSFTATGRLLCPCARCKNEKLHSVRVVTQHLFRVGFKGNYYIWSNHEESFMESGESSSPSYMGLGDVRVGSHPPYIPAVPAEMFHDAFATAGDMSSRPYPQSLEINDVPACDDQSYAAFIEANQPLYEGCSEDNTRLFLASCILRWKSDYNIAESGIDDIVGTMKRILPGPNAAPESYYETKKMTKALGLPVHKIDVCENNCMLFW